jgi:GTP-binding protein
MVPIITIIGRPNVGKSTLFNRLTRSKSALVVDLPGTTRDRNYGFGKIGEKSYIVVDTAGITDDVEQNKIVIKQINKAIVEAQVVLFVVDARAGLMPADLDVAKQLRKFNKKIILVVNKIDGVNVDTVSSDFFSLGFSKTIEISAKANKGINKLASEFINEFINELELDVTYELENQDSYIKVAIVGQPNAGKSTLINNILGEERVIVQDSPGTTRDSIYIPTKIGRYKYMLIDTAGVRRKARVKETIEKFSVLKTLQAIEDAQVVVLLIDAQKGIVEQDLKLVSSIIEAGRSLVLAINKWDSISKDSQNKLQKNIERELSFINFIKPMPISALHGSGIKKMFFAVVEAFESATKSVVTNKLSLLLEQAVAEHQPPLSSNGKRIKLRYAHLGGHLPFKIIIHGNQVNRLPDHYKKYLSSFFRERLQLQGTVVNIELKKSDNPYV